MSVKDLTSWEGLVKERTVNNVRESLRRRRLELDTRKGEALRRVSVLSIQSLSLLHGLTALVDC